MEESNNKFAFKEIVCIILFVAIIVGAGAILSECEERREEKERQERLYGFTVDVSRYEKIHYYSDCSGMVYYTAMSFQDALDSNYALCKKCWAEGTEGGRKLNAILREEERYYNYRIDVMEEAMEQEPPDLYP